MTTPIALPISHSQVNQTSCKVTSMTEDVQLVQEHRPSDGMIEAGLSKQSVSDATLFPIPDVKAGAFTSEALAKLSPISAFLKIQEFIQTTEIDDRLASSIQTMDIQRAKLSQQLSASVVDLVVEKETLTDAIHGDRQCAIRFCSEACLNVHADLLRERFFNNDDISETSFSARNVILNAVAGFLHEAPGKTEVKTGSVLAIAANGLSWEARQLNQWSKENDIGIAMLRMFVATWNRVRDILRVERQMQIAEIKQRSEAEVAALIQQGKDKFIQEVLNACASIASSVIQMAPLAHSAYRKITKAEKNSLVHNLDKNLSPEARRLEENTASNKLSTKTQKYSNRLQLSRAVGEGVAGIVNVCAAFKGFDAAKAFARSTEESNWKQLGYNRLEHWTTTTTNIWTYLLNLLELIGQRQNQIYTVNTRV